MMKCVLLDEDYSFEMPDEAFGHLLKENETVSVVKAELIREGVLFVLFIRQKLCSDSHRIVVTRSETFGDDGVESRWMMKDKAKLMSYTDAVHVWSSIIYRQPSPVVN